MTTLRERISDLDEVLRTQMNGTARQMLIEVLRDIDHEIEMLKKPLRDPQRVPRTGKGIQE